jgi:hypothetical protein
MYPFGEEATSLVALIKDKWGNPADSVKVRASITSEECVKAKLAQDTQGEGANQIYLAQVVGKLTIGDRFLLRSSLGATEYCRIMMIDEITRCCRLEQPLQFIYEKSSLLFPVIESQSDAKGELVLFFKPYRVLSFGITLDFTYGNEKLQQQIILKQASLNNLGIIRLVN